ncbi:MAG: acyl-CoA dehydrogenase family protein, partial [Pseudomonadota bacterium]
MGQPGHCRAFLFRLPHSPVQPAWRGRLGFFQLMMKLQQERLVCAMCAVFAAERILDSAVLYCRAASVKGKPLVRS